MRQLAYGSIVACVMGLSGKVVVDLDLYALRYRYYKRNVLVYCIRNSAQSVHMRRK